VPGLGFCATLLGEEPALEPDVRFYQRLLAMDQDGATEIVETALNQQPECRDARRPPVDHRLEEAVGHDLQGAAQRDDQQRLAPALEANPMDTDPFWAQEARNLAWAATFAWGGRSRDRGMGENFAWLVAHRFGGRKIIVWAHNNHVIADHLMYLDAPDSAIRASVARMPQAQRDSFMYFGDAVRRLFGKDVFTIAMLSHEGTYSPGIDVRGYVDSTTAARLITGFDSVRPLPPTPAGTLEAALAKHGVCAAFVDLRPFAHRQQAVRTRAIDYTSLGPLAVRWWVGYDAFLFLGHTSGLNEAPPVCGPAR